MANSTGKLLFGMEVEFGFSAIDDEGEQIDPNTALGFLFPLCAEKFVHLDGRGPHYLHLTNGSLLYPDVGHPEFATAETLSPESLLQAVRAGEAMLTDAAKELETQDGIAATSLYRSNVDYSAIGTTWGCHESYLSRRRPDEYAEEVVDHLVSRIIYSGAGGFNNQSRSAVFALSPRVFHLNAKIGNDGRGKRAIFSLRDESLSTGNYHRVHLICGEANCSELSTYLKVGTTALVLAMADAGVDFGRNRRRVTDPINAIGLISRDPECRATVHCVDGARRSALDIQRNYLELAERHIDAPFMPVWAEEVCAKWRSVLDDLSEPEKLVGSLDWPTKLAIFKKYVSTKSNLTWELLEVLSSVTTSAANLLRMDAESGGRVDVSIIKRVLRGEGPRTRIVKNLTRTLQTHGLDWDGLDAFQDLRDGLCELDMRYGQLHPQGIYLDLEEAGEIRGRMLDRSRIEAAIDRAPDEGRARVRGDWVRKLAGKDEIFHCDWTRIVGRSGYLSLGDPFLTQARWRKKTKISESHELHDMRERRQRSLFE